MDPSLISSRYNWGGLFFVGFLTISIMGYVGFVFLEMNWNKSPEAPGLLGWSIYTLILLLSYELLINTLIQIKITQTTITFRKPWKRFSVLFRKSRQQWILKNEEWDEVFAHSVKSTYMLYFRKNRVGAFFATIEDGRKMLKAIEAFFPDKKIHWNPPYDYPKALRKKMKKEFPERVMRG